jgi:hypothetical protein
MTSENEELQNCKSAAQAALSRILAYLEPICRTLQEEEGQDPNTSEAVYLPLKGLSLLHDAGHLEGLRLKALGALSGDILNLIQELGLSFEVEVRFDASFKLPFVGSVFHLECKSMNPWRVEAWRVFHGGLLSAYALQPLHLEGQGLPNPLEATLVVREGEEPKLHRPAEFSKEAIHAANNLLTGILNYSSLILKSPTSDGGLTEKVGLIQEAARKLALKILPNPPGNPDFS